MPRRNRFCVPLYAIVSHSPFSTPPQPLNIPPHLLTLPLHLPPHPGNLPHHPLLPPILPPNPIPRQHRLRIPSAHPQPRPPIPQMLRIRAQRAPGLGRIHDPPDRRALRPRLRLRRLRLQGQQLRRSSGVPCERAVLRCLEDADGGLGAGCAGAQDGCGEGCECGARGEQGALLLRDVGEQRGGCAGEGGDAAVEEGGVCGGVEEAG